MAKTRAARLRRWQQRARHSGGGALFQGPRREGKSAKSQRKVQRKFGLHMRKIKLKGWK